MIVGGLLIFVMLFGIFGYGFGDGSGNGSGKKQEISYNGFNFTYNENGYWVTEIQGIEFGTFFNPTETENITLNIEANIKDYTEKPLYYASNDGASGLNEIMSNIGRFAQYNPQEVCVEGEECLNEELIVKNCTNNIIIFKNAETIKDYKKDNCVFLEAPESEQRRLGDKFIFKLLDIQ